MKLEQRFERERSRNGDRKVRMCYGSHAVTTWSDYETLSEHTTDAERACHEELERWIAEEEAAKEKADTSDEPFLLLTGDIHAKLYDEYVIIEDIANASGPVEIPEESFATVALAYLTKKAQL